MGLERYLLFVKGLLVMNAWNFRATYYRYARRWGFLRTIKRAEDHAAEELLQLMDMIPARYLDLGCGQQEPLPALRASQRVAVDSAPGMLKRVGHGAGIYPVCADICNLPFKEELFSLAVAIGVAEYLKINTLWLEEVARRLKPGGFFLLTATNPGIWALLRHLTGSRIHCHPREDILNRTATAGFSLLRAKQLWTQEIYLFRVQVDPSFRTA